MFLTIRSLWRVLVVMLMVTSFCSVERAFSQLPPDDNPADNDCQVSPCEGEDEKAELSYPNPQATIDLKVVTEENKLDKVEEEEKEAEENNSMTENPVDITNKQDVAILSVDRSQEKQKGRNRTFSWASRPLPPKSLAYFLKPTNFDQTTTQAPPLSENKTDKPSHALNPIPIVTVTSRILSLSRRQDGNKSGDEKKSSLTRNPQPRSLQFDPVPEGDPYSTDTTHAQPTVLAWAGSFVSLFQPSHFPMDLVREALERRITAEELVRESLRAEPGFIVCMGVGLTLAVGVPFLGVLVCCCRLCGRCGSKRKQHHHTSCFNCQRRTLVVTLTSISVAVLLGVIVVIVSNERLGGAVSEARMSVKNNVRDLDTFLRNTKMQLRYLVSNSLEQTVGAIYGDLDDIEYLLGRPLQRQLAAEAQIEVALDSLLDISSSLRSIAGRMRALEESRLQAAARAEELRGRLYDLSKDIERFVERCSPEDVELCNTIDTQGLELGAKFDSFTFSEQLRLISAVENHNLTETARHARLEFENIPSYVESATRRTRDEVKRAVRAFRARLYAKVRGLDNVAFDLEVRTRDMTWRVDEAAASLQDHELYRWYTGLGIALSLAFVWTLMTVGLCCGCCAHSADQAPTERSCISNSAGQTIISSVFFMFVLSGVLWAVVVAIFVVGAHAHAFICHPLYEEPGFPTLTHLVDDSGMVFKGPVLSNVLHKDRDVHLSIGHVLSQCKEGGSAYQVFQLRHYFDVESEVNHRTTLNLEDTLGRLKINLSHVELLSPEAESHLDTFLRSIKIDLEPYRREMEKPLVRKSLPELAEQMQNIAGQLRSVSSSAELFKMVARTRNLVTNTLYPLEKRKEDVTYQVATLDMEAMPLQRQINQSSGHLRTIQYFIHNHGSSLAADKARGYVERILSYTRQYADHVRTSAFHQVAPCTPVWNLFDSARGVSCNGIIEPLNALWLATGWCLLLFLPAICMSLGLARFYLRMDQDDDTLPLQSNGSPSGSNTNVPLGESSTMWGPKNNGAGRYSRHSHSHSGHQQNGPAGGEAQPGRNYYREARRGSRGQGQRHSRQNSGISQPPQEVSDIIAAVQVAAWRDAWKAGASFVTMELVARHVQRSIDWVQHHWNDDPRVLARIVGTYKENLYQEPGPPTNPSEESDCGAGIGERMAGGPCLQECLLQSFAHFSTPDCNNITDNSTTTTEFVIVVGKQCSSVNRNEDLTSNC